MFRYFIVFALDETRYKGRGEELSFLSHNYLQAASCFPQAAPHPPYPLKKEKISFLQQTYKE
jgi:hypothetical protein